jgi:hypothetical protein
MFNINIIHIITYKKRITKNLSNRKRSIHLNYEHNVKTFFWMKFIPIFTNIMEPYRALHLYFGNKNKNSCGYSMSWFLKKFLYFYHIIGHMVLHNSLHNLCFYHTKINYGPIWLFLVCIFELWVIIILKKLLVQ